MEPAPQSQHHRSGGDRPATFDGPPVGHPTTQLMHVLVAEIDIHLPAAGSLKEKRSVVTSIVRNLDQMHGVAAAEVGHQDVWQRAALGTTVVGGEVGHVRSTMDAVERYVWSRTEIEVLEFRRSWWEGA